MKIISLNVNNFGGSNAKKPIIDDYKVQGEVDWPFYHYEVERYQNHPNRIHTALKLSEKLRSISPDMMVLQEFDYHAPAGVEFRMSMAHAGYREVLPDARDTIESGRYSITVMFIKKTHTCISVATPSEIGGFYRWCEIQYRNIVIIGIHIPYKNSKIYWDALRQKSKAYAGKELIIIGDLNAADNPTTVLGEEMLNSRNKLLAAGMKDVWIARGGSEKAYTYLYFTRIDYALATDRAYSCIKGMQIVNCCDANLSDHNAVLIELEADTGTYTFN